MEYIAEVGWLGQGEVDHGCSGDYKVALGHLPPPLAVNSPSLTDLDPLLSLLGLGGPLWGIQGCVWGGLSGNEVNMRSGFKGQIGTWCRSIACSSHGMPKMVEARI